MRDLHTHGLIVLSARRTKDVIGADPAEAKWRKGFYIALAAVFGFGLYMGLK